MRKLSILVTKTFVGRFFPELFKFGRPPTSKNISEHLKFWWITHVVYFDLQMGVFVPYPYYLKLLCPFLPYITNPPGLQQLWTPFSGWNLNFSNLDVGCMFWTAFVCWVVVYSDLLLGARHTLKYLITIDGEPTFMPLWFGHQKIFH